MEHTYSDSEIIAEWKKILKLFYELEQQKNMEIIKQLMETVKLNPKLTYRQIDNIRGRCENVLNGTYGNTKTAANLAYGQPSSK